MNTVEILKYFKKGPGTTIIDFAGLKKIGVELSFEESKFISEIKILDETDEEIEDENGDTVELNVVCLALFDYINGASLIPNTTNKIGIAKSIFRKLEPDKYKLLF